MSLEWVEPASFSEARDIQTKLRELVRREGDLPDSSVRIIAGVDASLSPDGSKMIGAVSLFKWPGLEMLDVLIATKDVTFPYVPGYLSFREIPVLIEIAKKIKHVVDLAIVDGQGIAHPRRLGLASHLGLVTGWRTIGCAKSRLIGYADEPYFERGSRTPIIEKDERVGTLLRTRTGVKPVWISIGHGLSLVECERWILATTTRFRLPEPVRTSHSEAGKYRKAMSGKDSPDAPSS